jgi:type IV fimbrial biogenesis protein FimT
MLTGRRRARGVTLIELAVALTVLALLMFAVLPSVGVWVRNTQVRNTASSIYAGLQVARNEAIRRNAAIRFSLVSLTDTAVMNNTCALSNTGVSWVVSVRDPSSQCQYDPSNVAADANDPMIVDKNAGGQGGRNVVTCANVADGSAGADTVVFNGFGRVDNGTPIGFIDVTNETLSNDYRRFRIEVAPGGAVRMCDLAVTSTTDARYCPTRATACS